MATRTVGPSGRDFTSVNAAIQASSDNPVSRAARDLILVDYAIYTEMLDFRAASGGWQIPCIVRAADPNNRPVIQSNGNVQAGYGSSYRGTAVGETELDGLIFSGWNNASNAVLFFSADGLIVDRCHFVGCTDRRVVRNLGGNASRIARVDSCTFETSGSSGAGSQGIILTYSNFTTVRNCKAICPTNVQFQNGQTLEVLHNTVLGTWNTGGNAKALAGVGAYRGNIVENLGTGGSHAIDASGGGSYIENFAFGTFTTRFAGTDGGSNQNVDPLLVNTGTGDLRLQAGSPASRSLARSASALLDLLGVTRSDPTDAGAYEMSGATTVASAAALSSTSIKLTLTALKTSDASWTTPGNFTVTPPGGGAAVAVSAAVVTDAGMSITLTVTEHRHGATYTVGWSGLLNITTGTTTYAGIGVAPTVTSVVVVSANTIRVTFSEPMDGADAALVAPANYVISTPGLVVPVVTAVTKGPGTNPTYVDLTIAGGVRNRRYTLTVKA